jgi:hypothetical protein
MASPTGANVHCIQNLRYTLEPINIPGVQPLSEQGPFRVLPINNTCVFERKFDRIKPGDWKITVEGIGFNIACQMNVSNNVINQYARFRPGSAGCST